MNANNHDCNWADSWVIAGVLWSSPDETDLAAILCAGEMLNHAIYTDQELRAGIVNAQKRGLITIRGQKILVSEKGRDM
jgi:hypothetical protein